MVTQRIKRGWERIGQTTSAPYHPTCCCCFLQWGLLSARQPAHLLQRVPFGSFPVSWFSIFLCCILDAPRSPMWTHRTSNLPLYFLTSHCLTRMGNGSHTPSCFWDETSLSASALLLLLLSLNGHSSPDFSCLWNLNFSIASWGRPLPKLSGIIYDPTHTLLNHLHCDAFASIQLTDQIQWRRVCPQSHRDPVQKFLMNSISIKPIMPTSAFEPRKLTTKLQYISTYPTVFLVL